jgi:serine protease Do
MKAALGMTPLTISANLTQATTETVKRVQRSLTILHNGRHGIGAGIIWGSEGLILTNYHVIAHSRRVRTTLASGETYPAQLLAKDPEIDMALLKIKTRSLPKATIADSRNLQVGQLVMAIGHPWGQRGVVTAGLISSLHTVKSSGKRGEIEIIRSDARLAPGNSGGPLINANGAVVGINTMIVGGDQGIAIPSHIASAFVDQNN